MVPTIDERAKLRATTAFIEDLIGAYRKVISICIQEWFVDAAVEKIDYKLSVLDEIKDERLYTPYKEKRLLWKEFETKIIGQIQELHDLEKEIIDKAPPDTECGKSNWLEETRKDFVARGMKIVKKNKKECLELLDKAAQKDLERVTYVTRFCENDWKEGDIILQEFVKWDHKADVAEAHRPSYRKKNEDGDEGEEFTEQPYPCH